MTRHRETPHGDSTARQPRGEEGARVNEWMEFGGPGDEWRECFLCGKQEDS